jgi:uncharacterized repeat protein (TIGR04138 family)
MGIALQTYGPMARTVLEFWGLEDRRFRNIVFNPSSKVLSETDSDSPRFENIYDSESAFAGDQRLVIGNLFTSSAGVKLN